MKSNYEWMDKWVNDLICNKILNLYNIYDMKKKKKK